MRFIVLPFVCGVLSLAPSSSDAQWNRQTLPADIRMVLSIGVAGESAAAAAGYVVTDDFHGRAAFTTDAGATWNLSQLPDSARSLVTVVFTGADTGFCAAAFNTSSIIPAVIASGRPGALPPGEAAENSLRSAGMVAGSFTGGMLLGTTDGGQSWDVRNIFPDSVVYLLGASFVDSRLGYVTADFHPGIGDPGVLKTTNGGTTWTTLPIPDSITSLRNVFFIDSLRGIAVGSQFRQGMISGVAIRTTDGGASWARADFPAVSGLVDVDFPIATTGYAVGSRAASFIYKTTDAGVTWAPLSYQPDTVILEGICFAPGSGNGTAHGEKIQNDSVGFPLPSVPVAVVTSDGGLTWNESYVGAGLGGYVLAGGAQPGPLKAYLGGGNGTTEGLMLHTGNGGVTAVPSEAAGHPSRAALLRNFPNPFNSSTTLDVRLPEESWIRIDVFNILGGFVSVIAEGRFSRGSHAFRWDAPDVPGGVYYCTIAGESFRDVRKLVLLR